MSLKDKRMIEKFNNSADKLLKGDFWIYVEGRGDKAFYSSYDELNGIPIQVKSNKSEIISLVCEDRSKIGIVDMDYCSERTERVFPINFYSIENVVALYHGESKQLNNHLDLFLKNYPLEFLSKRKIFAVTMQGINIPKKFEIRFSENEVSQQYHNYIDRCISCYNTFLRYKDLKMVTENYYKKYLKKKNFLWDLYDRMPNKSLEFLFSDDVFMELQNFLV